jgi:hypothetical protein
MHERLKAYVTGAFDELFPIACPDLGSHQPDENRPTLAQ